MKLLVVIPAFNEEKDIGSVISGIPKNIEGISQVEILVVDDGSTDNTAKIAKNFGVRVVSHKTNRGLGAAFRTATAEAMRLKPDVMVNIDADGQFDPQDIPKLLNPIFRGEADAVTASRFKEKGLAPCIPFFRKLGNKLFTTLVNLLIQKNFTDTQCGFRAYSKEAILRLNLFGQFTYTQEVLIDLLQKGLRIVEVPIRVRYFKDRKARVTSFLPGYFIKAILIIFRTFRDYKPLVFFGLPGLGLLSIGFILNLYSFIFWLITSQTTPVRMIFFVGMALIVLGLLLVILSLIADMLKRIRQNQEEILYKLKKREYEQN